MAFPTGYTKYQIVTIDNTKVGATQAYFPVLLTEANFQKAGADIFDTCRSDGGDIRITSDAAGTTELPREIVTCTPATPKLEIWVKVTSLAGATDTLLYVWYNGTDTDYAITATYGAENVWHDGTSSGPNYKAVHHLSEDPTGTILDSTSNSNDGTMSGTMLTGDLVDGQIGKGYAFDGSDDKIDFGAINHDYPLTFSCWIKPDVLDETQQSAMGRYYQQYLIQVSNFDLYRYSVDNVAKNGSSATTNWAFLAVTYDGSTSYGYLDGSEDMSDTTPEGTLGNTTATWRIGNGGEGSYAFPGIIDEARILNTALSATWLLTEYNNQYSPSTFYSVGDEQTSAVGHSRGEYAALPSAVADLTTAYTTQNDTDVATDDGTRVAQSAQDAYFTLHQFKEDVTGETSCTLTVNLQSNLAPSVSSVYLQIYNHNTTSWTTVDTESAASADTDFTLTYDVTDLTNYKSDNIMTCRVYQENA